MSTGTPMETRPRGPVRQPDGRRSPRPALARSCALPQRASARRVRTAADWSVRLTRRGRRVRAAVVLVILVAALVCTGVLLQGAIAAEQRGAPVRTKTVMVKPGQTLWQIAEEVAPGSDPRVTVDRIAETNQLGDAGDLAAGQRLEVPVGAGG